MPKISRDLAIPAGGLATIHPRESLFGSALLGALNAEVIVPCDACSSVSVRIAGTYVGVVAIEGTIDGANWDSIPLKTVNLGGTLAFALNSGAVGRFHGPCAPFKAVRARMGAWTSGAADVVLLAENGVSDVVSHPKCADTGSTNTGASGAAVTLTLGAAGTGLYHRIDRVVIQRFAAAALTAAATPVLVTTTNLPGSRVFSFPADAALQGSLYTETFEPSRPLRSSAANTATTIVAPATTGVIWRLTADYDVSPL